MSYLNGVLIIPFIGLKIQYAAFYNEDQSAHISQMVNRFVDDLDVNGDGELVS
jgi:hypothetical protein